MSHEHCYAISPVIHNDSFERVDFNINLHGDYKSNENFDFIFEIFEILKFYENLEIMNFKFFFLNFKILNFFWKFWNFMKFNENWNFWNFLKILKNFRVFVNRRWSPSVPNKYKTFIQSSRGTKSPRKRFTLPIHSLKNYGPLNSQTTGKGEK